MSECRSFRIFGGLLGLFFDDYGNIEYGILPNRIRMTLVREHPEKIDGQTDRYTDRRKDRGNNDVYVSTERTPTAASWGWVWPTVRYVAVRYAPTSNRQSDTGMFVTCT
jgi:hypothetical protein